MTGRAACLRRLTVGCVVFGFLAAPRDCRCADDSPPVTVLPPVKVNADVPLVKVAEHTMLEARFAPAAVALGDFIYVIGGSNSDGQIGSVERFDPRSGKSEPFLTLKEGRSWHAAVASGERIYVLGGVSKEAATRARATAPDTSPRSRVGVFAHGGEYIGPTASVEIIDVKNRTVSPGPAMPVARQQFGAVASGPYIVIFGGRALIKDQYPIVNSVALLDTRTGQWKEGPNAPLARQAPATAIAGGLILYAGGYNGSRALDSVDLFNPKEGTWRTLPPLAKPMSAHALVFLGHHLFLFGSYDDPDELVTYDLKTRRSEVFTLRYRAARHTAAVAHGDRIYVFGGRERIDTAPLDLVQVFELTARK